MILCILALYMTLIIWVGLHWRWADSDYDESKTLAAVSILLPVRNEAEHVFQTISNLLAQSHTSFEVVVVNDHSEDQTSAIVQQFDDSRVRIFDLPSGQHGKKAALALAMQKAQYAWIVTIDADVVVSTYWLQRITENIETADCWVGPVQIHPASSGLEQLQRWDIIAMQGFTRFGIETGYFAMGNGANLAFRKSAYEKVQGYAGNKHIASGDDLFLLDKFQRDPTLSIRYRAHPEVIVSTPPCTTLRSFLSQRIRWGGKMRYVRNFRIQSILALVFLSNGVWIYSVITFLFSGNGWYLIGLVSKVLVDYWYLARIGQFFNQKITGLTFVKIYFLQALYIVLAGLMSIIRWPVEWKGRKISE